MGYRLSDSTVFTLSIGKRVLQSELVEIGIPVYSANVFEPVGKINKYLIKNFDDSYIIWGIDGDWMVNALPRGYEFYPTDHCGVMTVDESKVNPKYMAYLLEKEGEKIGFSRTLRASIDRIKNISIEVPNIALQNEAMKKIAKLESKITELEKNQINLNEEIGKVLKRELN